jgi:hypothetical protein
MKPSIYSGYALEHLNGYAVGPTTQAHRELVGAFSQVPCHRCMNQYD